MKKLDKEKLIDRMVRYLWAKEGSSMLHGMSFKEADRSDSFGYRETVTVIVNSTIRAIKKGECHGI
jgi:hypothetical protein